MIICIYLHFNYSIQKKEFLESKIGERKSKMGNGKSKIGRFIEHKRKENRQENKQILSRPSYNSKIYYPQYFVYSWLCTSCKILSAKFYSCSKYAARYFILNVIASIIIIYLHFNMYYYYYL